MKTTAHLFFILILFASCLSSCSSVKRTTASSTTTTDKQNCLNKVKGEYQSYFDSVESCLDQ